jgi:tetratricopeptide (TPR) repeat protein
MKYLAILTFCFISLTVSAQFKPDQLFGTWVKTKITYADGTGLADENVLKYYYLKYSFSYPNIVNFSTAYTETGQQNLFELNQDILSIKSPEGGLMNSLKVESLKDTLVLTQRDLDGLIPPSSLKYYFVRESTYQNSLELKVSDIHSVIAKDTIYKQSPKIYAKYKGASFQSFIYSGIKESISMQDREGHFVATFVVSKAGIADSLKIIENIDDKFTKRFTKVFNKAKTNWKPATLNGKAVAVLMFVDLGYSTSITAIPNYFLSQKGNAAYKAQDYATALYYFDQALEKNPRDKENLLQRGVCRMMLGNSKGACEDWNFINTLGGSTSATMMLDKYCK